MNTDALIKALAEDAARRPTSTVTRMALALAGGGLISSAWLLLTLGVRPDIADALQTWRFVTKLAVVLVCVLASLRASARLAHPDADQRRALAALTFPVAMLALAVGWELVTSPPDSWATRAIGTNWRLCLTYITLLSLAPLGSLLLALRAGAPRSPATAGAAAGLLAGSLSASLYALQCFDDSPLFVAVWYVPTIAAVSFAGAIIGSRVLQW